MTSTSFITRLVRELPDFRSAYDEHLAVYEELLPHVLLGDFTRWLIVEYRLSVGEERDRAQVATHRVQCAVELIKRAWLSEEPEVQELIDVSFIENLWQARDDFVLMATLFTPELERELQAHYGAWRS